MLGNVSFCCIQIYADLAARCRAVDQLHPKEALKCPKETQITYIKLRKTHLICILYQLSAYDLFFSFLNQVPVKISEP